MFKIQKKIPRNILEGEIRALRQQVQLLDQEKQALYQEIERIQSEYSELKEEYKKDVYDQFSRNDINVNQNDFYAGVIDIPNLRSLPQGWNIEIKDWIEYQDFVKTRGTLVTVVGNFSKGKTFLFELLSERKTPHGFNVNTQGISIVYLKDKNGTHTLPIIGLDSKGSSLPLDISSLQSTYFPKSNHLREHNSEEEKVEEDTLKEILRDHEATEDILQNFIMEEASVIIIMVADLTFDDQKLVNKIKKKYKNDGSKKLIVVHNLYHTHYIKDAEYKINEFILKAFTLEERAHMINLHVPNKVRNYYVENSSRNGKIPHIILAKQFTEAGDYFNDVGIEYIKECINTNDHAKSIDIIQAFYRYLQKSLPNYIKTVPELTEKDIKLVTDDNGRPVSIFIEPREKMQMKAVFADEFGYLHIFKDGFQPNYALYEEEVSEKERYLCIKVECPDSCGFVKSRIFQTTNEFKVQIKGIKDDKAVPRGEVIADTRHFGEFFVETDMYKKSKYNFDYVQKPQTYYINGMAIMKWKLLPPDVAEGWKEASMVVEKIPQC